MSTESSPQIDTAYKQDPTAERIAAIARQIGSPDQHSITDSAQPLSKPSMSADKDPITCHVLDTTTGLPAPNIEVNLVPASLDGSTSTLSGRTNNDGRIAVWQAYQGASLKEVVQVSPNAKRWKLVFHTSEYYLAKGITPFFPKVEVDILIPDWDRHVHVPLLLGPYSYSTYRGS